MINLIRFSKRFYTVDSPQSSREWIEKLYHELPNNVGLNRLVCNGKSRDRYWKSSYLKSKLQRCPFADAVVEPENISHLQKAVEVAHHYKTPLTLRGSGKGYMAGSFCMHGGLVIHFKTYMNEITDIDNQRGIITFQPGASVDVIREVALSHGWDLRVYPTPLKDSSTMIGFLASNEYGVGSIEYGSAIQYGNIYSLKMMTVEKHPKVIDITAEDEKLLTAIPLKLGTSGIICEVSLPLTPAVFCIDMVVSFESIESCLEFGKMIYHDTSIYKRSMSIYPNSILIEQLNTRDPNLEGCIPPSECILLMTVGEASLKFIENKVKKMKAKTIYIDYNNYERYPLNEIVWQGTIHSFSKVRGIKSHAPIELLIDDSNDVLNITKQFELNVGQPLHWIFNLTKTDHGKMGCVTTGFIPDEISLDVIDKELKKLLKSGIIRKAVNPNKIELENIFLGYDHSHNDELKTIFDPDRILSMRLSD